MLSALILLFCTATVDSAQVQPPPLDSLINYTLNLVDLPIYNGPPEPHYTRLGLYTNPLADEEKSKVKNLPNGYPPYKVWHTMAHWSADESGILINDILLSINGNKLEDGDLKGDSYIGAFIRDRNEGDTVIVKLLRNDQIKDINVVLKKPRHVEMKFQAPVALGDVRPNSWLQKQIQANGLSDWVDKIKCQMQTIANVDFCTYPFTENPNPWRLNAVTYLHNYPMRVGAYSRIIVKDLWDGEWKNPGLSGVVQTAAKHLDIKLEPVSEKLPKDIESMEAFFGYCQRDLDVVYSPISKDLPTILKGLELNMDPYDLWWDTLDAQQDGLKKRQMRLKKEAEIANLFSQANKIDYKMLYSVAQKLAGLADEKWLNYIKAHAENLYINEAPLNESGHSYKWEKKGIKYIIGTPATDIYTEDCDVLIDLGGSDQYMLPPIKPGKLRCIIDFAGHDTYITETSGIGSGYGGIEVIIDQKGNDTYRADRFAQGSGLLGVGLLADLSGDDIYSGSWCVQGSGFLGIGILYDKNGNDSYLANAYSQAFGYTYGFGALMDKEGNDTYKAGWKIYDSLDRYPKRAHLSMSQGFGFGMRPWSTGVGTDGGIGVLTDKSGHDVYAADLFSQGGSYWYALGILHDEKGSDRYTAGQYSQGSGIHLSFAALLDDAGDDMYDAYSGLEQGNAHDWSSGCLEDMQGRDTYRGNSSSQGAALTVAFAYLLDAGGDDWYFAPLDTSTSQGGGSQNSDRRAGSLGLLLDLGNGADYYTNPAAKPGSVIIKSNKGILYDDGEPTKK